jgi:perosamine synthetase
MNKKLIPRQIVYPIQYSSGFLPNLTRKSEYALIDTLQNIMKTDKEIHLVGRARIGIFLSVEQALNMTNRKGVLLSSFTIPAVVNMVICTGAVPIFIDTNVMSTNINLNNLEDELRKKPAALILTHYHVNQFEYISIKDLCEKYGVQLIEDCAISMGGESNGAPIGSLSDSAVYSFSSFKFLNYYYGGAIVCNNESYNNKIKKIIAKYPKMKVLQYAGQAIKTIKYDLFTSKLVYEKFTHPYYRRQIKKNNIPAHRAPPPIKIGYLEDSCKTRPSNGAIQEWAGKVNGYMDGQQHRVSIASIYNKYFSDIKISPEGGLSAIKGSSNINYPIHINNKETVYKKLINRGFDVGMFMYENCSRYPGFENIQGSVKNTEEMKEALMYLPTHAKVSEDYAEMLSKEIKRHL